MFCLSKVDKKTVDCGLVLSVFDLVAMETKPQRRSE